MRSDPPARRWRLVGALEARKRGSSVARLAAELGVSARTVYRDLRALAAAGAPVASERDGSRTVWRLAGAAVTAPALTLAEAAAVNAAARAAAGAPFANALAAAADRARGSNPDVDLDALTAALTDGGNPGPDRTGLLATLAQALDEARSLEVRYQPPGRLRPVHRRLHPLALRRHPHGPLLVAEGPDDGPLMMRIDRIRSAELGPPARPTPPEPDLEGALRRGLGVYAGEGLLDLRIDVRPIAVPVLADRTWHPSQRLDRRPDGSAELRLTVADTPVLRGFLRAFGPAITVLEPVSLARDLAEEAAAVHRAYARRLDLPGERPARRPHPRRRR